MELFASKPRVVGPPHWARRRISDDGETRNSTRWKR